MKGNDFAVYIGLAHGAGDELGVLAAKIEDDDLFRHRWREGTKTAFTNGTANLLISSVIIVSPLNGKF